MKENLMSNKLPSATTREVNLPSAEPSKIAYQVVYTDTTMGHAVETREVVITADKMSTAVAYVEGRGGSVTSAQAVLNGARCITL